MKTKTANTTANLTEGKVEQRPPLPPFNKETAIQKIRLAEDGWNTRDPERIALAYTKDSIWRNRAEFATGRDAIVQLLKRKWERENEYRLIKELWAFDEWHDDFSNWFRSYGNENWAFNERGLMQHRFASINDLAITEADRKFHWPLGRRPNEHPGLSDLGL